MKFGNDYREPVRVLFHQNGGFTRLEYLRLGHWVEIRTEIIPQDLRKIGSRFILSFGAIRPEQSDSAHDLRQALASMYHVERMEDCGNELSPG